MWSQVFARAGIRLFPVLRNESDYGRGRWRIPIGDALKGNTIPCFSSYRLDNALG